MVKHSYFRVQSWQFSVPANRARLAYQLRFPAALLGRHETDELYPFAACDRGGKRSYFAEHRSSGTGEGGMRPEIAQSAHSAADSMRPKFIPGRRLLTLCANRLALCAQAYYLLLPGGGYGGFAPMIKNSP